MLLQSWRRFHVAGVHDHCDAAAGRRRRENRALGRSKSRRSRRIRARCLERCPGLLLLWRLLLWCAVGISPARPPEWRARLLWHAVVVLRWAVVVMRSSEELLLWRAGDAIEGGRRD